MSHSIDAINQIFAVIVSTPISTLILNKKKKIWKNEL